MATKSDKTPPDSEVQGKRGFPIVLVLVIVLLATAAGGGVAWFVAGRSAAHAAAGDDKHAEEKEKEKKPAPAQYMALDPAFVINLADEDAPRYLQADIQVMTRQAEVLEQVKAHLPQIRNNLLMLFAQQKAADLRSRDGREKLQAAALAEVQKVLQAETGKPGVEALYFTSFVTQ